MVTKFALDTNGIRHTRTLITMKNLIFALLAFCLSGSLSTTTHADQSPARKKVLGDSIPHSVSPRNDSNFFCIPDSIELRWTPGVSFFDSYYVEVCADSQFQQLIVNDVVFHDTTRKIRVPHADTTLYWRIRTDFDTTAIWHFRLHKPVAGSIVSPLADSLSDMNVAFVWHPVSGADRYEILIESENYTQHDTVSSKDTSTHYVVLGNKSYTWKVRALCGDGVGEWSNSGKFTIVGNTDVFSGADSESSALYIAPNQNGVRLSTNGSELINAVTVYSLRGELLYHMECDQPTLFMSREQLGHGPLVVVARSQKNIFRRVLILD